MMCEYVWDDLIGLLLLKLIILTKKKSISYSKLPVVLSYSTSSPQKHTGNNLASHNNIHK